MTGDADDRGFAWPDDPRDAQEAAYADALAARLARSRRFSGTAGWAGAGILAFLAGLSLVAGCSDAAACPARLGALIGLVDVGLVVGLIVWRLRGRSGALLVGGSLALGVMFTLSILIVVGGELLNPVSLLAVVSTVLIGVAVFGGLREIGNHRVESWLTVGGLVVGGLWLGGIGGFLAAIPSFLIAGIAGLRTVSPPRRS